MKQTEILQRDDIQAIRQPSHKALEQRARTSVQIQTPYSNKKKRRQP